MSVGVITVMKDKAEGSTRLIYTGLSGELEHLKILFIMNRESES